MAWAGGGHGQGWICAFSPGLVAIQSEPLGPERSMVFAGQHTVLASPRLAMDSRPSGGRCKQESACPFCGGTGCRDGLRIVKSQVGLNEAGKSIRITEIRRCRWRCSACGRSWTAYEPGGYPCRTFTLAVEAAAVAELATAPGATLASVARAFHCDRRTVGRWARHVAFIADPSDLSRAYARLDPSGLLAPFLRVARSGLLLLLLDHLARLLRDRGVPPEPGPGLASILRWQFDRFRTIAFLTRASPPLRVSLASAPA